MYAPIIQLYLCVLDQEQEPWLNGVVDSLQLANGHGVETVTIPLLFNEHNVVNNSRPVSKRTLQQVEAIVRCVYATLVELARLNDTMDSLRNIRFMLPPMSKDPHSFSKQCHGIICEVFHLYVN